jgi:hypothetical protein
MPLQATEAVGVGLVQVVSNKQLLETEKAKEQAKKEQNKPEILSLAAHIQTCWEAAKIAKMDIEQRLLQCARQRKGQYDPEDLAEIRKFGGCDIYMMLTNMKCRAAEAWISDIMLPPGEKPWGIDPTPEPDLPNDIEMQIARQVIGETTQVLMAQGPNALSVEDVRGRINQIREQIHSRIMKQAKEIAHVQERRIEDDFREGGFYTALRKFIRDLVTYPAAFMKGPTVRKKKKLVWEQGNNGRSTPRVKTALQREYDRLSPFDAYPSPGARSIQDGYFIERERFRRSDLIALIGTPGCNEASIRAVLDLYGEGGLKDWLWTDTERSQIEDRPQESWDPEATIDGLRFWGQVQGKKLREWGMKDKDIPDPEMDYQVCAIKVGPYVIMARLNPHPLGRRPYYSASFEEANDSIYGKGVPERMRDIQRICNATARSIVNNMGLASGPLVEVHKDRVEAGENIEDIFPWKIIKTKSDEQGRNRQAVYFYQPNMNAEPLMRIYEYYFQQASEQSGIPAYIYGSQDVSGAGKTASGLSMLLNAASKTLKDAIRNIDNDAVIEAVREHWLHVMLFDNDIPKTGDINVVARASEYLVIQEQLQARQREFLDATNNPTDFAIVGIKGRAEVLREAVRNLKMPVEDIVPTREEIERREQAAMQPPPQRQLPAPQTAQSQALTPAGQPMGERVV